VKIMMLTAGTRGDVEPFAALARQASARGHEVRLAVPDNAGADVSGLDVVSLHVDFAALIADQGVAPWAAATAFRRVIRPAMGRMLATAVEQIVAYAPDVVVYHPKVLTAPIAADALNIPSVVVESVPSLSPTREFASPVINAANLGPFNRVTYRGVALASRMFRHEIADACRSLPSGYRFSAGPRASLMPISPQLLARPSDWPSNVHLTGSWAPAPAVPDQDRELDDFIADGEFICAGFGSMKAGDARQRANATIDAARDHGLNVLIVTGWGGLDVSVSAAGQGVLVRESVNHGHVFPKARAVIHHGGAGTVHAVARAGVPSIVVPFIGDQRFWGNLLHRRALAPEPIPYRRLTRSRLADALTEAREYSDNARQVGERIRSEDGLAVAVDVLENLADKASRDA
jgi:sterol 3beta-glucosyltransferase